MAVHDDVIKWKHFLRYWPFVRGIHRSPGNSPHKGQWRGALMFSLICARINCWVNNGEAGDLRRHRAHHDVIVMHFCPRGDELNIPNILVTNVLIYMYMCVFMCVCVYVCVALHLLMNKHMSYLILPYPIARLDAIPKTETLVSNLDLCNLRETHDCIFPCDIFGVSFSSQHTCLCLWQSEDIG